MDSPKNDAIKRVTKNANTYWIEAGVMVGENLARNQRFITSADIDITMMKFFPNVKTHEKRAMVAVMKRLAKMRVIEFTRDFVSDPRVNCHEGNKRVWRSLVYANG